MRDIIGFEGLYAITSCGKVWSYKRNQWVGGWYNGQGYHLVRLRKNKKNYTKRVHILVAEAFLDKPNDPSYTDVGHLDDCPNHNWLGNLKWMTRSENLDTDHFRERQAKKIFTKIRCIETGEIYNSQRDAGRAVGIHPYGITCVLMGRQKTAGGYHWERTNQKQDYIYQKKT